MSDDRFENKFLEKLRQKRNVRKAKIPLKNGKFKTVSIEEHAEVGTDDVYMISVEVHNRMNHDIFFDEDHRYIMKPVSYRVKAGETVILPHQRMIVRDEYNSPVIDFVFNYGENKGKGIKRGENEDYHQKAYEETVANDQ